MKKAGEDASAILAMMKEVSDKIKRTTSASPSWTSS